MRRPLFHFYLPARNPNTERSRVHACNNVISVQYGVDMGKPNYSFQKRQREIAKQKKKEEKRLAKLAKKNSEGEDIEDTEELDDDADTDETQEDGSDDDTDDDD